MANFVYQDNGALHWLIDDGVLPQGMVVQTVPVKAEALLQAIYEKFPNIDDNCPITLIKIEAPPDGFHLEGWFKYFFRVGFGRQKTQSWLANNCRFAGIMDFLGKKPPARVQPVQPSLAPTSGWVQLHDGGMGGYRDMREVNRIVGSCVGPKGIDGLPELGDHQPGENSRHDATDGKHVIWFHWGQDGYGRTTQTHYFIQAKT